jgi:hypothetical protein
MARFKVIAAAVNRLVDGNFVSHRLGEVIDLAEGEAKRLLDLKAVAPVNRKGEVTKMPEPGPKSPLIEDGLEEVGESKPAVPETPPPSAAEDDGEHETPDPAPSGDAAGPDSKSDGQPSGGKQE